MADKLQLNVWAFLMCRQHKSPTGHKTLTINSADLLEILMCVDNTRNYIKMFPMQSPAWCINIIAALLRASVNYKVEFKSVYLAIYGEFIF